jgi:hypothetical protein
MAGSMWPTVRTTGSRYSTAMASTRPILPTAEPMVRRLAAGGNRIRTIGPAAAKGSAGRCQSGRRHDQWNHLRSGPRSRGSTWGALPWPFRSRRDRWFESGSLRRRVHFREPSRRTCGSHGTAGGHAARARLPTSETCRPRRNRHRPLHRGRPAVSANPGTSLSNFQTQPSSARLSECHGLASIRRARPRVFAGGRLSCRAHLW